MGKRLSVDDKLAALGLLRDQPISPETTAELRRALGDKSNLVVASAAGIAGEQRLVDLAVDLDASFKRFLTDPEKTDKLCRASLPRSRRSTSWTTTRRTFSCKRPGTCRWSRSGGEK